MPSPYRKGMWLAMSELSRELDKEGETRLSFKTGDEEFIDKMLSLADAYQTNPNMNKHLPAFEAAFEKFVNSDISTIH